MADPNIPELRMIGSPPNQTWQWKFADDQWRDMMGTINTEMKRDKDREVTALPDWIPLFGGTIIKKGPSPFSSFSGSFGESGILSLFGEDHPKAVVDFDILANKTDLLPDGFLAKNSPEYLMAVAELWREVTGYVPAKGNQAARYDNQQTYKGAVDADRELFKIAGDLSEEMNWRGVAEARGYEIDWGDADAVTDFIMASHDDFVRGVKYDDEASASTGKNFASNTHLGEEHYDSVTGEPVIKPSPSGTARKVIAELGEGTGNKRMANEIASRTPNAKAEEIDGQWVVTVPPGQGGFESIDAGDAFIRDAGLDATEWEMASSAQGEFVIREIKPEAATQGHDTVAKARAALEKTGADPSQYEFRAGNDDKIYPVYTGKQPGGQFGTRAEAEQWLKDTGGEETAEGFMVGPTGYEVVATPEGKWVVREKAEEPRALRYSTADTPGDMFAPTIT